MDEYFYNEDDDFVLDLDDALEAELEGTEWESKVGALDEETPMEDRVRLYQQIRNAGVLPENAAFFLLVWALESIAEERVSELYELQYAERFARMEEKYDIDETLLDAMDPEELPEEYRALQLEFAQAVDGLTIATFQTFGEHKMANLFKMQPEDFDTRYDDGYEYFFGEMSAADFEGTGELND